MAKRWDCGLCFRYANGPLAKGSGIGGAKRGFVGSVLWWGDRLPGVQNVNFPTNIWEPHQSCEVFLCVFTHASRPEVELIWMKPAFITPVPLAGKWDLYIYILYIYIWYLFLKPFQRFQYMFNEL